jgi:hypothetical protein
MKSTIRSQKDNSQPLSPPNGEVANLPTEAPDDFVGTILDAASSAPPNGRLLDTPGDEDASFDLSELRLSQDFESLFGAKNRPTTIPIRKPSKEWFIRTHDNSAYYAVIPILELKEDREIYLVAKHLWPSLEGEQTFGPRMLMTAITRQGTLFVWPLRVPGDDAKSNSWNDSALDAAKQARSQWTRLQPDQSAGGYQLSHPPEGSVIDEPKWPDYTFQEILDIAFRDRRIARPDHPVLRRLRGEV